jgi:hypothetical protein
MRLSTHHVIHKFVLDLKEESDGVYTVEVDMPSNAENGWVPFGDR